MSKMSINEASDYFGISKEAIHNRIRRGSLECVVEDGIKFVVVDKDKITKTPQKRKVQTSSDDKYHTLLEQQNAKLQAKIDKLEEETRLLRDQKEQMLIDERIKVEQIYKDKDEQLKNILNSFKAQFLVAPAPLEALQEEIIEEEVEMLEDEIKEAELLSKEEETSNRIIISLKKYLKEQNISQKQIIKIKARFKKIAKKDERVISIGKKYYLDLDKYDYKDLIR